MNNKKIINVELDENDINSVPNIEYVKRLETKISKLKKKNSN